MHRGRKRAAGSAPVSPEHGEVVRCSNCGGGLWGRLACISAFGQRRRMGEPPRRWRRWVGQSCRWGRWGVDKRWRWRWGMGQPPWLWRRRCMGQSLVGDFTGHICVAQEINRSLGFLPADLAEGQGDQPFIAVIKSRDELLRWPRQPSSDVRVTMPASPGFAKAVRLAALRGAAAGSLWMILEEDLAVVVDDGADAHPPDFVPKYLESLIGEGAECTTCLWQQPCGG